MYLHFLYGDPQAGWRNLRPIFKFGIVDHSGWQDPTVYYCCGIFYITVRLYN